MISSNILVVEDEEDIQELIAWNLRKAGHTIMQTLTGEEGLELAMTQRPDLIVLDLMLPGASGLEICRKLKSNPATASIGILILTARGEEEDVVRGLEAGGDDYVTKPFSPKVLLARIQALLRRLAASETTEVPSLLTIHDIAIDLERHEVRVGGKPVSLTWTEFKVLEVMAGAPGRVFTRSQLVNAVRGDNYPVTERSVDVQIVGLRRKLGPSGANIETVRGVGYRFKD